MTNLNNSPKDQEVFKHISNKFKDFSKKAYQELYYSGPTGIFVENIINGSKLVHSFPSMFREFKHEYLDRAEKEMEHFDGPELIFTLLAPSVIGLSFSVMTFGAYYINNSPASELVNNLPLYYIPLTTNLISGFDEIRRFYNKSKLETMLKQNGK